MAPVFVSSQGGDIATVEESIRLFDTRFRIHAAVSTVAIFEVPDIRQHSFDNIEAKILNKTLKRPPYPF